MKIKVQGFSRNIAWALLIAALPLQAAAIDFTPDASRLLSDPTYLPLKGRVFGETYYNYINLHANDYGSTGAKNFSYKYHTQSYGQDLAYGITNNLSVELSGSYRPNDRETRNFAAGGGTEDFNSKGFSDPSIQVTYRALDQKRYPVSWDVIAAYTPDTFGAKIPSTSHDGTEGFGGQSESLGTAVGYKTVDFTIEGFGGVNYAGDRKLKYEGNTTQTDINSYWGYYFGFTTQTRLDNRVSVNAGIRYTINDNENAFNGPNQTSYTEKPGNATDFNLAFNYNIIPNRLVAGVFYDNLLFGDTDYQYAIATSDSKIKDRDENVFGARLLYQF